MNNGLPKLGVAAIVKNELPDLREWIAFHLAVGVSHFLIADNGSNDGTREYLALLESLGLVTLLEVPTVGDEKPQLGAYRALLARCPEALDLLAFIDADEYLLPLEGVAGPPSLLPWLARIFADASVGALALNWACFGSSGARFREEGLVIERFVQRAPRRFRTNRHYKSIVRPERVTAILNPHHVALDHGHYVNARGQRLEPLEERPGLSRKVVWGGARVNHYLIKSVEEFLLGKSLRGSAATPDYHKGRDYFERFDRNDKTCRLAERLAPEVHRQLLALPAERQGAQRESRRHRRGALRRLVRWLPAGERARVAAVLPEPVAEWTLESPTARRTVRTPRGLLLQGRISLAEGIDARRASLRVSWEEESDLVYPLAFDRRQDGRYAAHFRVEVPRPAGGLVLRLVLDDRVLELERLCIDAETATVGEGGVLVGREGWLFLDRDTNASVHQHCGHLRLNALGRQRWAAYGEGLQGLAASLGAACALLAAPSKEQVMDQYHPLPAAGEGPVDQVAEILPTALLVHPLAPLRALGDAAYYVTDTHWTHRGALAATLALLEALGHDRLPAERLFAADEYAPFRVKGDLGGKLLSPRTAPAQRQVSFSHEPYKCYDNGLPNMGRMIVWQNPEALYGRQHCLLFGASSSLSMFQYLVRLFGRLTFVHSAGSIDTSLARALAPDVLLAQTNARFMTRAPSLTFSLADAIARKAEELRGGEAPVTPGRRATVAPSELARLGLVTWDSALPAGWFEP